MSSALVLDGVGKRYGDVEALAPLDLAVEAGELVVLVGPSGCGKTTALRLIAGLETPDAGTIRIGGADVTDVEPGARDVAMVFQNYALYPHMTVRRNLGFGLRMRGTPAAAIARRVDEAAAMLELGDLLDRKPAQLSGGQRQRVALGRALVRDPRVFLFDEPLSNLDAQLRTQTRHEIARLHRRLGATMVFVTHDQTEAMTLGDRIAVLRAGHLQQYGQPLDLYRTPANLFVARFLGTPSINTAEGTVDAEGRFHFAASETTPVATTRPPGPVVFAVRPEDVVLMDPGDPARVFGASVSRLEPLGNEVLVHVTGPGGLEWIVRAPPDTAARPDHRVGVGVAADRIHLFGPDGGRW